MLKVSGLETGYGECNVLYGVSVEIKEGEIVSLVGSNAAGKTTLLNTISGLVKVRSGKIEFLGKDITNMSPQERIEMGLIQCPEGRKLFASMTVSENFRIGAYSKRAKHNFEQNLERVYKMFPKMYERREQLAGSMSGGEQQMCAIGRAIMSNPVLLLLDEPSLGLAPIIVTQVFEIIEEIKKSGVTIFLVEQNVKKALSLADDAYVLENGSVKMRGTGKELLANDSLRKAYLGI